MRRPTKGEQKAQEELRTAIAALETARTVLSRVGPSRPPTGKSRPLTIHLWIWARTSMLYLAVLIDQLRAAAESTPEKLDPP